MHSHARPTQPVLRKGDCVLIVLCLIFTIYLYKTLWHSEHATKVEIRYGAVVVGVYSLNQTRAIQLNGAIGPTHIVIDNGKVRFSRAPCSNQYCVHQGWLQHAGQTAVCLPNQVSVTLLGAHKPFDTLNY